MGFPIKWRVRRPLGFAEVARLVLQYAPWAQIAALVARAIRRWHQRLLPGLSGACRHSPAGTCPCCGSAARSDQTGNQGAARRDRPAASDGLPSSVGGTAPRVAQGNDRPPIRDEEGLTCGELASRDHSSRRGQTDRQRQPDCRLSFPRNRQANAAPLSRAAGDAPVFLLLRLRGTRAVHRERGRSYILHDR